jgi:hypothetical protein
MFGHHRLHAVSNASSTTLHAFIHSLIESMQSTSIASNALLSAPRLVAPGSAPPITSPSSVAMSIPRQLRFVISAFLPTSFKIGATVHDAELEVHFFFEIFSK